MKHKAALSEAVKLKDLYKFEEQKQNKKYFSNLNVGFNLILWMN